MAHIHLILMPEYRDPCMSPPLGIASLAAYLKSKGIGVTCTDFRLIIKEDSFFSDTFRGVAYVDELVDLPLTLTLVRNYRNGKPLLHGFEDALFDYIQHNSLKYHALKNGIEKTLDILKQEAKSMRKDSIFGFSVFSSNLFYTAMLSLILRLQNPNIKIIYGGPQVSLSLHTAKIALKLHLADIIVLDAGEETLLKVVKLYEQGIDPAVDGTITYHKNGSFLIKPLKALPHLNTLPDPDFSVFPIGRYSPLSLPIYASRGCIYHCSFCSYNKQTKIYRLKEYSRVVDTMERMHKEYKTIRFDFIDSALNLCPQWLEQFTEELIKRKCNFQWKGYLRPHITEELLIKLKKTGLFEVILGVESFSNQVLKKMGKRLILSDAIVKTIVLLCSADIKVNIGIIVGFPGESKSEFLYTVKRLLELEKAYPRHISINPQPFQVRVSSDCYTRYNKYGLTIKTWDAHTSKIVPETRELARKIPMAYSGNNPTNRERQDRLILMRNIIAAPQYLSESDKLFMRECLQRVSRSSLIKIDSGLGKSFHLGMAKTKKYIFPLKKLLVDEKEMVVIKQCNGDNTVEDIMDILSIMYKENRRKSFELIVRVLRYLIDSNILVMFRNIT